MSGTATPGLEVTNISGHGSWILIDGRELFLPYDDSPWFRQATVEKVTELVWQPRGETVVMERATVSTDDFDELADRIAKRFRRKGITREDVEDAIRWARRGS